MKTNLRRLQSHWKIVFQFCNFTKSFLISDFGVFCPVRDLELDEYTNALLAKERGWNPKQTQSAEKIGFKGSRKGWSYSIKRWLCWQFAGSAATNSLWLFLYICRLTRRLHTSECKQKVSVNFRGIQCLPKISSTVYKTPSFLTLLSWKQTFVAKEQECQQKNAVETQNKLNLQSKSASNAKVVLDHRNLTVCSISGRTWRLTGECNKKWA